MVERAEASEIRMVRTLRHRFSMPTAFIGMIGEELQLSRPNRLKMFGTRQVVIEGADYLRHVYDDQIASVQDAFQLNMAPIVLSGDLRMGEPNNGMARLAFKVARQLQFDTLLSGLERIHPRLGISPPDKKNYLYIDVEATPTVLASAARAKALLDMSERILDPALASLYEVSPLSIDGFDSEKRFKPLNRRSATDTGWPLSLASNR